MWVSKKFKLLFKELIIKNIMFNKLYNDLKYYINKDKLDMFTLMTKEELLDFIIW